MDIYGCVVVMCLLDNFKPLYDWLHHVPTFVLVMYRCPINDNKRKQKLIVCEYYEEDYISPIVTTSYVVSIVFYMRLPSDMLSSLILAS